jgi:hypothetical protein
MKVILVLPQILRDGKLFRYKNTHLLFKLFVANKILEDSLTYSNKTAIIDFRQEVCKCCSTYLLQH